MGFDDVNERAKCEVLALVTRHTIERLLDIKSIYEVTSLQIEKLRENWKAVEESLYINYAIRDAGVIAVLGTAGVEGFPGEDFLITDEPASPETLVEGIGRFPLEPATCAYVFTILENYGDNVVELFNPDFAKERKAWHRDVRPGDRLGKGRKAREQLVGFCRPFEFDPDLVPEQPVVNLMLIKRERNSFAHDGEMKMRFQEFFRRTLEIICFIALRIDPDQVILIVHQTEDHSGRFESAEEVRKAVIRDREKE